MHEGNIPTAVEEALHEADVDTLERRIMELALEQIGAQHGALFLWDPERKGLTLDFHIVDGVAVPLPEVLLQAQRSGKPAGIALWVMQEGKPYLCSDTSADPHYARYFLEVGSMISSPIVYGRRTIGVISVSDRSRGAFQQEHLDALVQLAESAAPFLRRAQLYRASKGQTKRPFLLKGLSPQWLEVERQLERVAPTDAAVLIQGESGTGKELLAHAIHFNSQRADKPMVVVNCAAIPETLLESTLFGHVKGAFTGATATKLGEFQQADGGTLFLDEVGELSMPLQAKLLRAAESGEIHPLGSNRPSERVDVRILCATHQDLPGMVRARTFRDDLYYRLSVVTLELPPLREYLQNLPVLSRMYLQQSARHLGRAAPRLSEAALALLRGYPFPGNVRELRNVMEHAVIMARGDTIEPGDLPKIVRESASGQLALPLAPEPEPQPEPQPESEPTALSPSPSPRALGSPLPSLRAMREACLAPQEKAYLKQLLAQCQGNVRRAATQAGVNHVTLYRLMRKRGVRAG